MPDNTVGDKREMEGMVLATQHLQAGALGSKKDLHSAPKLAVQCPFP